MASDQVTTPNEPVQTNWYCCSCGHGPYNPAIFVKCINGDCTHTHCTNCPLEYVQPRGGSVQSEGHDDDHPSPSESGNFQSNSAICKSSTSQRHSFAPQESSACEVAFGATSLSPEFEEQPSMSDADGHSRDVTSHLQPVPPPEYSPDAPSSQLVDGEALWNCCRCLGGGYTFAVNLHCPNCTHYRCTACKIYERV